jgi:hypothetical protein
MTAMDHLNRLAAQANRHPRQTFGLLTVMILIAMSGVFGLGLVDKHSDPVLPIEFRLVQPSLSHRPVRIDHIRSCSCWHGPRDQAQRKYKFRVVNGTNHLINIGGGVHSVIRLIVAYPDGRRPVITMPASMDNEVSRTLKSPPDIAVPITTKIEKVEPSAIPNSETFFGVPADYSVWAIPATPNKLAEIIKPKFVLTKNGTYEGGEASYSTVVDKTELLPGEEYEGHALGHGAWIFYVPLTHRFAQQVKGNGKLEFIFPRTFFEKQVIFVGVAALAPVPSGGVKILGFGPAPSENALAEPGEL